MCCLDYLRVTHAPARRLEEESEEEALEARRNRRADPNQLFYSGWLAVPPSDLRVDELHALRPGVVPPYHGRSLPSLRCGHHRARRGIHLLHRLRRR